MQVKRFGPWRRELRAFLELFALTGVAVVQPALDLLGKNAAIFVSLRTSKTETVTLVLLIVLVPPTALWIVEVVFGLVAPRSRRWVHALLASAVTAVIAVEVLKQQTSFAANGLVILAVPVGLAVGVLVLRFDAVRLWLRYLAVAPVAFVALFLFASPVTTVVFDSGGAEAADVPIGRPNRVVMIVMDELPTASLVDGTGKIDAALFPNFAVLANTSTWYRNATTVAPYTEQAMPAILSGSNPTDPEALPVVTEYPRNLFTLLGNTYEMNVYESVTHLCPRRVCDESHTIGRGGFKKLLADTLTLWRHFAAPERGSENVGFNTASSSSEENALPNGERFVHSLTATQGPRLDFLHILMPHWPWHYTGTGQSQDVHTLFGTFANKWIDPAGALSGRQQHLLQLQATDRLLGQVIAKLRKIGAYDNTLIVVTADHGAAFTNENPLRGASLDNYSEIMWTPLLVKAPGQTLHVADDRPVESTDVLPTIAEILDVKVPWKIDGSSAFGKPRVDGERRLFEWERNTVKPPNGSKYVSFDGPTGFASVIQRSAWPTTDDPKLRLYGIGPYSALIGRQIQPWIGASETKLAATLDSPENYEAVVPTAKHAPWTFVSGEIDCPPSPVSLAITVNGTIAGLAQTYALPFIEPASCRYWSELVPNLFRSGKNDIRVYAITGNPGAPVAERIAPRG